MSYEIIKTKRSVREFLDKEIPIELIHKIANAGRVAQSSKNEQGWKFVVIRDKERLRELSSCGGYTKHIAASDFAIAIVQMDGWLFDLGQAAAYMQLAAWEEKIGSCLGAIYDQKKAKSILNIPDQYNLPIVISFGYPKPADPNIPKKKLNRKPFDDVVKFELFE